MARKVSDREVDEAVARIMEYAGVTDRGSGWSYRELRDYARDIESIIRAMLSGQFKQLNDNEAR
jgi:hypothetical protein